MTKAFKKISGTHEERNRNPDGLTWSQFIEKYPECKHIAILCWHLGCYPEELSQELKNLLEGGERMNDQQKVINGLEHCCDPDKCSEGCPYYKDYDDVYDCMSKIAGDALKVLKEQKKRINELEEKLRLLEYGDQDTLQSGMMPAT